MLFNLGAILIILCLFANIFMIIRAFLRGYSNWAWGLIVATIAFYIMSFIGMNEGDLLNFLSRMILFVFFIVPPIVAFRVTKLPYMPPLPCKGCGKEVTTKRKVAVNLDNNEIVTPRSTSLVLLITGGIATAIGIWLIIFALQYDQSVAGPGILITFGLSLAGTNLRALINKPKNLGLGYIYKCKNCGEKMVHVVEKSQP